MNDPDSVIPSLDLGAYTRLKEEGRVAQGMIPKLDNAFSALRAGAASVRILHSASLLDGNAGTKLAL